MTNMIMNNILDERRNGLRNESLAYFLFLCYKTIKRIIMDTMYFSKVIFHQIITLIQRDDGNKKNKTLETETGLPSV